MLRRLKNWYRQRGMSPEEREEYLMERVERLWEDWSYEYCTCNCHVEKWWREWQVYNNHVLEAAAEWGVDRYTFGDGDKRKITFSDECLNQLDIRSSPHYGKTGSLGPR